MCLGVVAILLLNVMDVFSVYGGALLDRWGSWKKRDRRDPCKTTRPIHLVKLFTDSSNTSNL